MKQKNLNILYFTRTMNLGGTENVILQLCEIMKPNVNKIVVCSCGGVNVEKLTEMGIKHYEIPDIEQKNLKIILITFFSVFKIVINENINVVHTHHRMAALYSSFLLFFRNFSFISTAHNTFHNKKRLTAFAYKKSKIIAVGNKVKENLCSFYGLPDEQITVIHNAVKPFDWKVNSVKILTKHRKEGFFLVGNIGRLSEQKGMEYFIKSVPGILKECPKVKFYIIGEGEDRRKYEKLINDMGLNQEVILLGYRNDIQNLMSQLDLIVLSSLWEGLPLTLIEAFSVGKTVIATAVDGTVEIVQDEGNGLLVEPRNSENITNAVTRLIHNSNLKKDFEKNAEKTYEEEFSFKILKKSYLKFYGDLDIH